MNYFNFTKEESKKIKNLKNTSILMTGGTGFFGQWIIKIIIYLNDTLSFNIKLHILARTKLLLIGEIVNKRNDIFFIQSDVRNIQDIPDDIEYIIHAAATPDNRIHMSNPIETMDIISQGTKQILDISLSLPNLKNILNISSGQVYGNINSANISENNIGFIDTSSIKSIYAEAKRYSEVLSLAYKSLYKLPIVQVRAFSFIGPYMELNKPWAINNFIHDAIKFKKIKIFGNGKPIRSYMYPTDMAWWILNILSNYNDKNNNLYNLGSSEGISLLELATKIKNIIGNDVEINILNTNEDNSIFIPDESLIKNNLGLSVQVKFDEALKNTIDWAIKAL